MVESVQKIVPGAPTPPPLTKSQKKKRKAIAKKPADSTDTTIVIPDAHSAALVEKAPAQSDLKAGAVAEELVAHPDQTVAGGDADQAEHATPKKASPVVDLLHKRIRVVSKKISRIGTYSSKPHSELNDDQKRTLVTLPGLEAIHKELEETKKAIETLEAEQAKEAARKRSEAEEAEKQRISETLSAAEKAHTIRATHIFNFIHLHSLHSASDPSTQALDLSEEEVVAIYAASGILLGGDSDAKEPVISGFLAGEGEVEGVSYVRLLEITQQFLSPPEPESAPELEDIPEVEAEAEAAEKEPPAVVEDEVVDDEVPVESAAEAVVVSGAAPSTSFHFMQESELDNDPASFENDAEWVEKEDVPKAEAENVLEHDYAVGQNGAGEHPPVTDKEIRHAPRVIVNDPVSWADDEGGLPPIDGVRAELGTPRSATPDAAPELPSTTLPGPQPRAESHINGTHQVDADGFVPARGGRARGHPRVFRGAERGGFRGGERGGFRGTDRGTRGTFRGDRGGYRGRSFANGEGGGWRGGSDGEARGRGRGRGRGDRGDRGDRGGDRGGFRGRGGHEE